MKPHHHIISMLVEDKPGVLQRISCVFSKRGFNMETITVGRTEKPGVSRIIITTTGDDETTEQVVKQVDKLIDVLKVWEMSQNESFVREIALFKVSVKGPDARTELMNYAKVYGARIDEARPKFMMIELSGTPEKVDEFESVLKPFGIMEMVHTGATAISK